MREVGSPSKTSFGGSPQLYGLLPNPKLHPLWRQSFCLKLKVNLEKEGECEKEKEGKEEENKGSKGGGYGKVNDRARKIVAKEAIDGAHTNVAIEEEAVVVAAIGATEGPKA